MLMGEWKEYKLKDVAEIVGGGTPKTKVPEYWNGEIAWLTPRDLSNFNGRYISRGERNISKSGLEKSSAKILPKGAVLLSSRAPVGYLAIAENEITTNQGFRSLIPKKAIDNVFLFYLLKNNIEYLKSQSTGTTFGELAGSTLKSLSFLFLPLPEQKAIASVLSSLDDKIDLLHRQNKTLEAMAETLFRQWFVEPVRRSESEGGEAQEDWEEGVLGDVIELVYGKGLKQDIRTGKGYPVVGSSGIVGYHSDFLVEGPGIVIGRKGTLGKVIYLFENFYPIDTTYYIKSKVESAGLLYEYFLLKTLNFEEMNSDSAVPGLNRDIALSTEIKIAPSEKLHKFNQLTSTFIDKLRENTKQIRILEKLRDTLLPKLMSGEVRVQYDKEPVA
jgi:type I restriction enzyme S subunit